MNNKSQLLLTAEPEHVRRFRAHMIAQDAAPYLEPRPVPDPLRPIVRNPFARSFYAFLSKYTPGKMFVQLNGWQIETIKDLWQDASKPHRPDKS